MNLNLIVIDDFYSDPDRIRALALSTKFRAAGNQLGYNGLVANAPATLKRMAIRKISNALSSSLMYDKRNQGDFKLLTASHQRHKRTFVHVDHCRWSAVISLSPSPRGGTTFWRHRKWNICGFHDVDAIEKLAAQRALTVSDLFKGLNRDTGKLSAWSQIGEIGHVYNRMILFNGNIFHASSPGFGNSIENGKLSQTFFLEDLDLRIRRKDWSKVHFKYDSRG